MEQVIINQYLGGKQERKNSSKKIKKIKRKKKNLVKQSKTRKYGYQTPA